MKRFMIVAMLAAMVLSVVSVASAVEVKFKGQYDFAFKWIDNPDFLDSDQDGNSEDDFGARQRLRLQMDFIASEQLKGVFYIESGETVWGNPATVGRGSGGAIGADGVSIEVRRAYIEFLVPNTSLTFKVGIQGFALPSIGIGDAILGGGGTDMAGVVASYGINDNIAIAAAWFRALDAQGDIVANSAAHDEIDVFGLVAPMNFDGIKFSPYFLLALEGKDAPYGLMNSAVGLSEEDATTWWGGFSFELSMFDPLWFGLDFVYGSTTADEEDEDRAGWYLAAEIDYSLGFMTPGLAFWYTSGEDDDFTNGSEMMPSIDPGFYGTTFGTDGYNILSSGDIVSYHAFGTMGVALLLKDISFVEDLTHTLRIAYIRGTNDEDAAAYAFVTNDGQWPLTTEDSAWEIDLESTYMIYDELALFCEMGYVNVDLDEDTWGSIDTSDAWKLAFGLQYKF